YPCCVGRRQRRQQFTEQCGGRLARTVSVLPFLDCPAEHVWYPFLCTRRDLANAVPWLANRERPRVYTVLAWVARADGGLAHLVDAPWRGDDAPLVCIAGADDRTQTWTRPPALQSRRRQFERIRGCDVL